MAGMYPNNETISLFGEDINWPGVDPETGKFTNGDFKNPLVKPSYIPAETVNLILDNLANLITGLGESSNNKDATQLKKAIEKALALKANLASPTFTGTPRVPSKTTAAVNDGTLIATEAQIFALLNKYYPVGYIIMSAVNKNPAEYLSGTWTVWGSGRVPVGVNTSDTDFNTVEKTGGSKTHTLTTAEMPVHTHIQDEHNHIQNPHNHIQNPHAHTVLRSSTASSNTQGGLEWRVPDSTSKISTESATATNIADIATNIAVIVKNQNTGSGASHNNIQPYITVYWFKKTAL